MHVGCIAHSGLAQVNSPWRCEGPSGLGFPRVVCMHDTWILRAPREQMAPQHWCISWYLGGHFVSRCTLVKGSPLCQIMLRLCNTGARTFSKEP